MMCLIICLMIWLACLNVPHMELLQKLGTRPKVWPNQSKLLVSSPGLAAHSLCVRIRGPCGWGNMQNHAMIFVITCITTVVPHVFKLQHLTAFNLNGSRDDVAQAHHIIKFVHFATHALPQLMFFVWTAAVFRLSKLLFESDSEHIFTYVVMYLCSSKSNIFIRLDTTILDQFIKFITTWHSKLAHCSPKSKDPIPQGFRVTPILPQRFPSVLGHFQKAFRSKAGTWLGFPNKSPMLQCRQPIQNRHESAWRWGFNIPAQQQSSKNTTN